MLLYGSRKAGHCADGSQVRSAISEKSTAHFHFLSLQSNHHPIPAEGLPNATMRIHPQKGPRQRPSGPVRHIGYIVKDSDHQIQLKFFTIPGQPVYHRWECIEEGGQDTFGMLVHSCYVDNGFGDRVDILDENGCGLDAVSEKE
jgi:hypothetical protein